MFFLGKKDQENQGIVKRFHLILQKKYTKKLSRYLRIKTHNHILHEHVQDQPSMSKVFLKNSFKNT